MLDPPSPWEKEVLEVLDEGVSVSVLSVLHP